MRTNIDIDDDLMAAAMAAGGFKTKREAVQEGLRLVGRRKFMTACLPCAANCNGTTPTRVGRGPKRRTSS